MRDDETMDRLLTPAEVAEYLRVPVSTLHGWRQNKWNVGPPAIKVGKRLRYPLSGFEKWLDEACEGKRGRDLREAGLLAAAEILGMRTDAEEQRLRAMVDSLQWVARELAYVLRDNFFASELPEAPEQWSRLLDAAEILGNWDPDDEAPEDGYEVLFTTCDDCDRLVIPVVEGTAALDQCRYCPS